MAKFYIVLGTALCLLTAYANFTGWKIIGAANASNWGPKGATGPSGFRHK